MDRAQLHCHTIHVIDDIVETKYKKQLEMMYSDSDKGSFASIFGYVEVDIMFVQYLLRHDFTFVRSQFTTLYANRQDTCKTRHGCPIAKELTRR